MNLSDAIHFSLKRVELELFSPGSVFSIYSLAASFSCAIFILTLWRFRRRGRVNLRALLRAIFSRKLFKRESTFADINLFILSVTLMPVIVGALVISSNSVALSVHSALNQLFGVYGTIDISPLSKKIISTIILFLAYEIGYYVDHYLKHRVSILWELHKLHHTADVLTPLTNFRNHPIDNLVFGYMLAFFIGGASGFLDWMFAQKTVIFSVDGKNIIFIFFLWTIGHLQHSEFWIPFRGLWGYLILSPAHHQIHHSRDPQHFNRNLGSVLAIWDWLFGTLEIPSECNPKLIFGAKQDGSNPHSLYGILVTPFINSVHALFDGLIRRLKNLFMMRAQGLR
ncbi:sterol desaturase [Methylocystaceae bacterium]|nr:sterol desaturase [Methylocystaceae bacterium]